MNLDGASALITGGASGIGAAAARALTERGARCVLVDLNEEAGEELAAELGGVYVPANVADPAAVQPAVAAAAELGPLRAVVNSAGTGKPGRTVGRDGEPYALDDFERVIRVNLIGTFNVVRLAAAAMARTDAVDEYGSRGAVVNIASIAAFEGQIGQAAYSASKGGIVGMTLPIARDLAAQGIRVNTVAPGSIDTPIWGRGRRGAALKASVSSNVVFPQRLGTPDEVASVVVELITNDYINADVIRVDGGIRMPPR
jgi:NAD(P)-dependent dehydrogenase (short-subunit alcohol dehydrogenase family)